MHFFEVSSATLKSIYHITINILIPKSPPLSELPSDVLRSMKANSSPLKSIILMKLNKFFIKEQCPFNYIGDDVVVYAAGIGFSNNEKYYKIDELPNDLGISGSLIVVNETVVAELIQKIIIYDLKSLSFHTEKVSFKAFELLLSLKPTELYLGKTIVASNNDEIIPYEELFDHMPSVRHLSLIYEKPFSQRFLKKLSTSNFEKLTFYGLDNSFDFETFMKSLKGKPTLDLVLNFVSKTNLSRINQYIDDLLEAGKTDYYPPLLLHFLMDTQKVAQLEQLRKNYLLSKSEN
uniref:Uncharacterized protein n=1 Tax=Panagrolaimus davidi TaxID=227884 RepID=A0A914QLN4_9BILA